ncbi:MAG: hypothetical protein DRI61_15715, partial [Chloroflexi bacterium]
MAKSTFLQLCQDARRYCGISGTGPSSVSNQTGIMEKLVNWVADSDLYIQRLWANWNFLHVDDYSENILVNTIEYTAPSDIGTWDMTSFWLDYSSDSGVSLTELDYLDWRNNYRNGTQAAGKPSYIARAPNKNLILHQKPDASYTLTGEYWKTPTKMTGNTDTSNIPEYFERIIIVRAKLFYAEDQEAREVYQTTIEEYRDLLNKLEAAELPAQEDRWMSSTEDSMV